jgi:hypothetical protein
VAIADLVFLGVRVVGDFAENPNAKTGIAGAGEAAFSTSKEIPATPPVVAGDPNANAGVAVADEAVLASFREIPATPSEGAAEKSASM